MANEENLTMMGKAIDSTEKAQKLGAMGGKKSGESKRLKKTMAQIGQSLLEGRPSKELSAKTRKIFPHLTDEEINNKLLIMAKLYEQAMKGNLKAIEIFRDTIGEKPINVNEHSGLDGQPLKPFQVIVEGVKPDNNP